MNRFGFLLGYLEDTKKVAFEDKRISIQNTMDELRLLNFYDSKSRAKMISLEWSN